MDSSPAPTRAIRPAVRWFFRCWIVGTILLAGAVGAEAILRRQQRAIGRSNQIDAGLVLHDRLLGWRLQAGWSGGHRHHDFSVRYAVNARGFRADTPELPRNSGRPLAVALGDSYTFGYGVNDHETFVHQLHAQSVAGFDYFNAGVPGYSTDQEALLLENELWSLQPQRVLLFVYLANDLLDNLREVPLQLRTAKPRFEPVGGELVLRNVSVPVNSEARIVPWMPVVLGEDSSRWSTRTRLEFRYELFRLLSPPWPAERDYRPELAERFAPAVTLFDQIVGGMARSCARRNVELTVVLLAGGTYYKVPRSPSAQYQDFFAREIVRHLQARSIPVIHVAELMRERFAREGTGVFHPHEGHLTAAGHRRVAEILARELKAPAVASASSR